MGDVLAIRDSNPRYPYQTSFSGTSWFGEHELQSLINENMDLRETAKMVFMTEPEKSFVKAGIQTVDGNLTSDGVKIWNDFLVRKFGAEFKTEVVDLILAQQAEK